MSNLPIVFVDLPNVFVKLAKCSAKHRRGHSAYLPLHSGLRRLNTGSFPPKEDESSSPASSFLIGFQVFSWETGGKIQSAIDWQWFSPLDCQKHWPPISYIRFARPIPPDLSKCLNVAGGPFQRQSRPVTHWRMGFGNDWKLGISTEMWEWLKGLLLNIKWQVKEEFSCPSK